MERSNNKILAVFAILILILLLTGVCVGGALLLVNSGVAQMAHGPVASVERATTIPPVQRTPTPVPTMASVTGSVPEDGVAQQYMRIYQKVNPSVVYIDVGNASGSGFVWDKAGHIVTNNHVVNGAKQIRVTFSDDASVPATLVGQDPDSDLAVIKVDPAGLNLRPVQLGDSIHLKPGERAIAIGNPFGQVGTMTVGIVSAIGRTIQAPSGYAIPEAIQTDAAINPGNSGGPLLDYQGRVIGVTSQIESPVRASSGIGFAIPVQVVKRVVPSLIQKGHYDHPFIGMRGITLSPELNKVLGLPLKQRGAYVLSVLPDYPAAKAGLKAGNEDTGKILGLDSQGQPLHLMAGGDIIVGIENQPVRKFDDILVYLFRYASPGDTVQLHVLRHGKTVTIPVTLTIRPKH